MKTPREILLARHRAAEPKLDAARGRALAALSPHESGPEPRNTGWLVAFQEFFRIPRIAWGGLAAAWVVIIALNVASRETIAPTAAPIQETKRTPETLQALREQKRLFAELVGSLSAPEAEAPRFIPRPRSELQSPIVFA